MNQNNEIDKIKEVWNKTNDISTPNKFLDPVKVIDELASFFSPGEYHHFIFNFQTLGFDYISDGVKRLMKLSDSEFESFSIERMLSYYHPEDLELMQKKEAAISFFLFNKIKPELLTKYKVTYLIRYQLKDGSTKKILHQSKTINVSLDGKIQQVMGVHSNVSHIPGPIDHTISFIGDGDLPSYFSLDPDELLLQPIEHKVKITKQELKILRLLAVGKNSKVIGEELFISESTVKTHRKNIMAKSEAKNTLELIANCVRRGLI